MKILALHADFIEFEAKKRAVKVAEEIKEKHSRIEECLVVFCAVEKRDEKNPEGVSKRLVSEIRDVASQVKAERVVLYPYVHLTSNPSKPDTAQKVLGLAEEGLKGDFSVARSPFGWYKSFTVACKGHPLSELSREFGPEEAVLGEETESLKRERKLTSYWHILDAKGVLHEISKFDFKGCDNLKVFSAYEKEKSRAAQKEPAHIFIMKKLELVDHEPASDSGNLRYYPKGRMIKSLIEEYVTKRVSEYGGMEVETPLMYDINHPTLSKYLQRFPARQYQIESDKRTFFLRFAACFGQFLMAHDATISYRQMPLKLYELTRYSFRREQSGELTGLRRLRAFTMPDVHAMVSDMDMAKEELRTRLELSKSVLKEIGIGLDDIEMAIRMTKDFYENNKGYVQEIVRSFGKPVLVELWDERIFYFVLKYEFNFVDTMGKASALSTDQIDIENAERYGIRYAASDNSMKTPLILHCSPSGAIERVMYALLEKAAFEQAKGIKPTLPLWLCPTQARVIPVSAEYTEDAVRVCDALNSANVRSDIDDRPLNVGKKIRASEVEWIPFTLVIGENEKGSGALSVRIRGEKEQKRMDIRDVVAEIAEKTKGMPYRALPLPKKLSMRPIFAG